MKALRRTLRIVAAGVVLFGVAAGLQVWWTRLPRIRLRTGAEFRVVAMRYGTGQEVQGFRPAQLRKLRVWDALPKGLQKIIPSPDRVPEGEFSETPAIVIWFVVIDPETHEFEPPGAGKLTVILDNGQRVPRAPSVPPKGHPDSTLAPGAAYTFERPLPGEVYNQVFIVNPPHDSRYLRVAFRVWDGPTGDEIVRFKVKNPAYQRP